MNRTALVLTILLSASTPARSQTAATGAIAGTVRDQTGAVVPAADVMTRNVASNETRQVATQSNGRSWFRSWSYGRARTGVCTTT